MQIVTDMFTGIIGDQGYEPGSIPSFRVSIAVYFTVGGAQASFNHVKVAILAPYAYRASTEFLRVITVFYQPVTR